MGSGGKEGVGWFGVVQPLQSLQLESDLKILKRNPGEYSLGDLEDRATVSGNDTLVGQVNLAVGCQPEEFGGVAPLFRGGCGSESE